MPLTFTPRGAASARTRVTRPGAAEETGPVHDAGSRLISTMTALVTEVIGAVANDAAIIARLTLLLWATIQGISSLVAPDTFRPRWGPGLWQGALVGWNADDLGACPERDLSPVPTRTL
jgi:hypothetical protein